MANKKEIAKKMKGEFIGQKAYEKGRHLVKLSPQRVKELKAIGDKIKQAHG